MRILVFGAGAIGGYVGALLARAGHDVTLVARGAQLAALRAGPLEVAWADGRAWSVPVRAAAAEALGEPYDLVFVTLKSNQLAAAAADLARLVAADGSLVMIQNGLPWWYFERIDSPWRDARIDCLDRDGTLARTIPLDRVVGAVIHKPVTATAPGRLFVPPVDADRLIVGEVDGRPSDRLDRIAALIGAAGLPTEPTGDIRAAKWRKLLINLVWNPLCTVTQSAPGHIAARPAGAALARRLLEEGAAVARAVGVDVRVDAEAELRRVQGNFRQQPSMVQDVRAGRPLELDAIVHAVVALARVAGIAVPTLETVGACVDLLDARVREDGVSIAPAPVGAPRRAEPG